MYLTCFFFLQTNKQVIILYSQVNRYDWHVSPLLPLYCMMNEQAIGGYKSVINPLLSASSSFLFTFCMVAYCSHFPWLHFFGRGHLRRGLVKGSFSSLYGNGEVEDDDSIYYTTGRRRLCNMYIQQSTSSVVSSGLSAWPSLLERLCEAAAYSSTLQEEVQYCMNIVNRSQSSKGFPFVFQKSQWPLVKNYIMPIQDLFRIQHFQQMNTIMTTI